MDLREAIRKYRHRKGCSQTFQVFFAVHFPSFSPSLVCNVAALKGS